MAMNVYHSTHFHQEYLKFKETYKIETDYQEWFEQMEQNHLQKDYLKDLITLFSRHGFQDIMPILSSGLNRKYQNVISKIIHYIKNEYNEVNYSWLWIIVDGDLEKVNKFLLSLDKELTNSQDYIL